MDNKDTNKKSKKEISQTDKNIQEFKDEIKKEGEEIGNTVKKILLESYSLFIMLIVIICIILYVFFSGGMTLYLSKLGSANILPTNKEFFPYTNVKPTITPSTTHIFTNSTINFPYDAYNSSNYLLNGTRKYKDTLQSSFFIVYLIMTYFITIYENMIQFNYAAINLVLYIINLIPNDTAIMLLGPIIVTILSCLISIINPLYFIFTWFASLATFFEFEKNATQLERNADFKGIWQAFNGILNIGIVPISISVALFMALIMCIMFFFSMWWTFSAVSIILFLVWLSCYFYTSTINGVNVNIITTILALLKYYKFYLMILISFIILLMSFLNFGICGIVTCSLVLLLILFGSFNDLGLRGMFSST
jgi:hypothetical protein